DIIEATGVQPYMRADLYDYGVYLRLRYQTSVQNRTEIAYKISKLIFEEIQRTPKVDLAIPFVYSARAGLQAMAEKKEEGVLNDKDAKDIQEVDLERIQAPTAAV